MQSQNNKITYAAVFIAAASALQISEWLLPNPLPGLKLGLANMVTLTAIILYGPKLALSVAVGRTIFSSIIIGTFMSPTFILSFAGAVSSALVMIVLYRPLGKFSPVGVSISGALVHNTVQVLIVHYIFVRHPGILFLLPILLAASVITGSLNGYLAKKVSVELAEFSARRIFLASSSPRRIELLKKHGIAFTVVPPGEVEDMPSDGERPADYALRQAEKKVRTVYGKLSKPGFVISGDTVVSVSDQIFLKPGTPEKAVKMLNKLNGCTQKVITGIFIKDLSTGKEYKKAVVTTVKMKKFSQEEIKKISKKDYDKAGGYAIQGLDDTHIEYIKGSYLNVVGFPVKEVGKLLKKGGF